MKKTILIAVLVVAIVAVGYFVPTVRLFAMKAVGRSPVCPMKEALAADENLQSQILDSTQILKASKVVEKDPAGYHRVETPHGPWWIPEGNDFVLPFNLAEQARQIYGSGEYA